MNCVVTGAAGFIGSHLCEHLLGAGHSVSGVDAFIPYYPPAVKEQNVGDLHRRSVLVAVARDDPAPQPLGGDRELTAKLA